jgi:hypothetical protein
MHPSDSFVLRAPSPMGFSGRGQEPRSVGAPLRGQWEPRRTALQVSGEAPPRGSSPVLETEDFVLADRWRLAAMSGAKEWWERYQIGEEHVQFCTARSADSALPGALPGAAGPKGLRFGFHKEDPTAAEPKGLRFGFNKPGAAHGKGKGGGPGYGGGGGGGPGMHHGAHGHGGGGPGPHGGGGDGHGGGAHHGESQWLEEDHRRPIKRRRHLVVEESVGQASGSSGFGGERRFHRDRDTHDELIRRKYPNAW